MINNTSKFTNTHFFSLFSVLNLILALIFLLISSTSVNAATGLSINNAVPVTLEPTLNVKLRTVIYVCENQTSLGAILPSRSLSLSTNPANLTLRSYVEVININLSDDVLTFAFSSDSFRNRICNNQVSSNLVASYSVDQIGALGTLDVTGQTTKVEDNEIINQNIVEIINIPGPTSGVEIRENNAMQTVTSPNQAPNYVIIPSYCIDGSVINTDQNGFFLLPPATYAFSDIIGGQEIATCSADIIQVNVTANTISQVNISSSPSQNQFAQAITVSEIYDANVTQNGSGASSTTSGSQNNRSFNSTGNNASGIGNLLRTGGIINSFNLYLIFYASVAILAVFFSLSIHKSPIETKLSIKR